MQFATSLRNSSLSAISTAVGASFQIYVYSGTAPGVGNAATGNLLSSGMVGTWQASSGGTMTFTSTADSSAAISGTPGYVRLRTSGGTVIVECTAGIGSGEFNFNGTITAGSTVTETSGTFTAGNA